LEVRVLSTCFMDMQKNESSVICIVLAHAGKEKWQNMLDVIMVQYVEDLKSMSSN